MKRTILYVDFIILPLLITFLSTHSGLISYYLVDKKNTILELNNIPKGTVTALYTDQSTSEQQTITPSLEQKLGQFDPTYIDKATFTIDFREPIDPSTFTAGDITLTVDGNAQAGTTETIKNIKNVSPLIENKARVFEFTVTGMTAGDTVTASLEAGKVDYPNGTSNLAATSIDATVHYMGPIGCGALGLGRVTTNSLTSNISDYRNVSFANIGDLDNNGTTDIAVGTPRDTLGGAVYIHFMNNTGTVNRTHKIASGTDVNGPNLSDGDFYGSSIANIGDLDEDGITDIAVGATGDGSNRGAVYIHFMNSAGTVKENGTHKIANGTEDGNGLTLSDGGKYGSSIANIGDLDGDGITDIAVGAKDDDAVYIHFMNRDGSIKENGTRKIASGTDVNGPNLSDGDYYGSSIANIGDINGDGITDIAVGAIGDNTGDDTEGSDKGAVYIHFMNRNGTIKDNGTHKIASGTDVNGPDLSNDNYYGYSIANIGDINGDDITDIAVGAIGDNAVYIHFMNRAGGVKKTFKIDNNTEGINFPNATLYGRAITNMGDPDGDGNITIAVGSNEAIYLSEIQFICTPALEQKLGQFDPTYINSATFTVDFKEPIDPTNNFTAVDITLTVDGNAQAGTTETIQNIKNVSPLIENKARVFEFTVTGMTAGDTVTASLDAGKVEYSDGSTNLKATSIDATVHYMGPIGCGALDLDEVTTNSLNNINLSSSDYPGSSIANIGDLDGDHIDDIAVGTPLDNTGEAVYIYFMNSNGTVKETKKIASGIPNGPILTNDTNYGCSIANIGDLDGDGIVDIAVGDVHNGTGGIRRGAVYIHFMNSDGRVKRTRKIASGTDNGPNPLDYDIYGSSIANIGDLNGDGITDIAVGASYADTGGGLGFNSDTGAVYIHFMNRDGSIKQTQKISTNTANGLNLSDGDLYGSSIANIGDLNGDGIIDIAVGAPDFYDNTHGDDRRGAIYIHLLNIDGSIKEDGTHKIASGTEDNGPDLTDDDRYGSSIANIGDINGDGITDIAVGARGDNAVYIHFMNRAGGVKKTFKIDDNTVGNLNNNANYGSAITNMGDPDVDGNITIAVGSNEAIYLSEIQFICTSPALEQKLGQFDPTYKDEATFTVDFRKPIDSTTFTVGDIRLTGTGTVGNLEMVSALNRNRVFEFTVTRMTAGKKVTASLDAEKVVYLNGAPNTAATSIDATVRYVEPYKCGVPVFDIVPDSNRKIDKEAVTTMPANNNYGYSIANIGDLDGDHIDDIAVGAVNENTNGGNEGAVYIHFMNINGSIKENGTHKIANGTENGPSLTHITSSSYSINNNYGCSIANIGDLDGDGIVDIAVGDEFDGTGGIRGGAVYIHFMNRNGSVKQTHKIASGTDDNGPDLSSFDTYGSSIANIGDLNGDGITDIAVGANRDDTKGELGSKSNRGAIYIHFMNRNGTVKQTRKIASGTDDNSPILSDKDLYGTSIANIGDLDRDGIIDIAVGASCDYKENNGTKKGAIYIHLLNREGGINSTIKIDSDENKPNSPYLTNGDRYGISIANMGDLDGDGIVDIAVGAVGDDITPKRETLYLHFLRTDGSIKYTAEINKNTINNSSGILQGDHYGCSIANMGDLNGDGFMDMAVGAKKTNTNDGVVYFSSFGMYCPKYMRHGKYFLNGTLRFKKSLK